MGPAARAMSAARDDFSKQGVLYEYLMQITSLTATYSMIEVHQLAI
jgi:hypothetical protein